MGIKYLNLSSFGQFRQYRTKSLLQSFITVYKNSQRQSCNAINCISSGINILAEGSSLDIWTQRDRPALEAPVLHTLHLIARRQPWRHCVTSLRSAHWLASSLKLAARCPVSGCWPSLFYCWCTVNDQYSLYKCALGYFVSILARTLTLVCLLIQ